MYNVYGIYSNGRIKVDCNGYNGGRMFARLNVLVLLW